MPKVSAPQILPLMRKPAQAGNNDVLHKYIRVQLIRDIDLDSIENVNLVVDADWFSFQLDPRTNGRGMDFDISQQMRSGGIRNLSSVYIDNSAGNGTCSIQVLASGYKISCPPNSQGWFPLVAALDDGKLRIGYDDKYNANGSQPPSWNYAGGVSSQFVILPEPFSLNFFFTDLAVPPSVWYTAIDQGFIGDSEAGDGTIDIVGGVDTLLSVSGAGDRRQGLFMRASNLNTDVIEVAFTDPIFTLAPFLSKRFMSAGEIIEYFGKGTPYNEIRVRCNDNARLIWHQIQ